MTAIEEALPNAIKTGRRSRAQAVFSLLAGGLQLARLESDPDAREALSRMRA